MKKIIYLFILSLPLLAGCVSVDSPPIKKGQFPQVYTFDLDKDDKKEVITVEKSSDPEPEYSIKIERKDTKKDKSDVTSFAVPGVFQKIQFVDMNEDGTKQMAVYYQGKRKYSNLVIYNLKNDKTIKLFSSGDCCDIDAGFVSVINRIRLNRPKQVAEDEDPCGHMPKWESWVWQGEKFIEE
ncbi:MAG: hypothetical protein NTY47_05830 [Candidatus Omnitrophica bacterium]|nr:hypothetical protein [Candidatus Omnitrophota bacterium]